MKGRIDWYKILNIKWKREDEPKIKNNLNDENSNNFNIIEDKSQGKKSKIDRESSFLYALDRLKQMVNNIKEKSPSIINKKSFSFKKIFYNKIDFEKTNIKQKIQKNIEDNITKELTIKDEKNSKINCNNYYIEKNDENILFEDIKDENIFLPNLSLIDKNCK